jgi:hypothetical protein
VAVPVERQVFLEILEKKGGMDNWVRVVTKNQEVEEDCGDQDLK